MTRVMDIVINEEIIRLPRKKVESILYNPAKSAQAVHLVYVTDIQPGIIRVKKGKAFSYVQDKKPVKDKQTLQRIKNLVLPPAWENVWICTLENGHLQA